MHLPSSMMSAMRWLSSRSRRWVARRAAAAAGAVAVAIAILLASALRPPAGLAGTQPVQAYDPFNLVRLHVVANSDSAADQALKLQVRDAVLRALGELLSGTSETAGAVASLQLRAAQIRQAAEQVVAGAGYGYPVAVEVGPAWFGPTALPAGLQAGPTGLPEILPEGTYQAVRVLIGEAQGRNWWCVLFPPLCLIPEEGRREEAAGAAGSLIPVAPASALAAGGTVPGGPAPSSPPWWNLPAHLARLVRAAFVPDPASAAPVREQGQTGPAP